MAQSDRAVGIAVERAVPTDGDGPAAAGQRPLPDCDRARRLKVGPTGRCRPVRHRAGAQRDRVAGGRGCTGSDGEAVGGGRLRSVALGQAARARRQRVGAQRHGVVAGRLRAVFRIGGELQAIEIGVEQRASLPGIVVTIAADGDRALGAAAGECAERDGVRTGGGDLRPAALRQRIGARGDGRLDDRIAIIVFAIVDLRTECERVGAARTGTGAECNRVGAARNGSGAECERVGAARTGGAAEGEGVGGGRTGFAAERDRAAAASGAAVAERHRGGAGRAAFDAESGRIAAGSDGQGTKRNAAIRGLRAAADRDRASPA